MKIRVCGILLVFILLLSACRSTKYVPDGEYLLDKVKIKTDNKDIKRDALKDYLRQTPNAAIIGLFHMQLGIYNLSGKDTTKWINRTLKRIGDPPVIYSSTQTALSAQQIQRVLENKGYINAQVHSNTTTKGKKAKVEYVITSGTPYRLRDYRTNISNNELNDIARDTSRSLIRPNMLFDVDALNAERERISTRFRQQGYYNFNKDFLDYSVDSTLNIHKVDATMELRDYLNHSGDSINKVIFKKFTIRKVIFFTNSDVNATSEVTNKEKSDTVQFRDFLLVTPKKRILKLDALVQNTFINPKSLYSDEAVERTYSALNSLGPIKYVNISFKEVENGLLDCYIVIIPAKTVSLSSELEATYTAGYWGVAGNVNVANRNIFNGAETLSLLGRGAFEWQDGVWAQEYGGQVGLKFPRAVLPVGSFDFKRSIHANTEFTGAFSYQLRPGEFTTTNVGAGINYSWKRKQYEHFFQLFDLSYVQFPYINTVFRDSFLNPLKPKFNPYNYEDHFIMRMGYAGSYTTFNPNRPLQDYSITRYSVETAGNLLNGFSHLLGSAKDSTGAYQLFKIRYAQYVKGEFNITRHQIFDPENQFVYHMDFGIGIPYGNGNVIPFEKRFYSGGANSVRGWGESTLGPGIYKRITSLPRDFNQVGDIKLDLNMEYRTKMFWVMEGALFLDAGNIWTIKDYNTQPGGVFRFDTFMNQIAMAYGLGLRFNFSFFIFRIDWGLKLYDPVLNRRDQWRINPGWDDMALHFAIGYPF
ncbi:MAG: BamA/TamA family outer membrane protein [Bacteroidota bacterium]|nr:BamA/TamA family outer membrane protein [Bacteroidota bacterium]